jgi:pimeloyl-ACP methyl ester carboxylesterase
MSINYTSIDMKTTQVVHSQDGAKISYLSLGSGPAAIVIPGALSVAAGYTTFARTLAEHFTVSIIERRGRGLSDPQGADYSILKECEDVRALQQATGASLLVGHSFGGLVALEFARTNPLVTKVAVYEPGVSIGGSIPMNWMPGYEQKLAQHKDLDAFIEFTRGAGPDIARSVPRWYLKLLMPLFLRGHEREIIMSLLHESLREHKEVARLNDSYQNYREISATVLLMYGGKSDTRWVNTSMEGLAQVLPRSETREFAKLDHFGIDKKAPQEVAEAVGAFFLK